MYRKAMILIIQQNQRKISLKVFNIAELSIDLFSEVKHKIYLMFCVEFCCDWLNFVVLDYEIFVPSRDSFE